MENNTYEPQEPNAEEQLSPSVLSQPRSQSRAWPILLGAVIVGVSLIVSSLIYTKHDKSAPAVKREAESGGVLSEEALDTALKQIASEDTKVEEKA